jgi:hypothetical protein
MMTLPMTTGIELLDGHNVVAESPDQLATLRRELNGKLAVAAPTTAAGVSDLGSIGAKREDAEFLDEFVEGAMKARREKPWRLSPGE